MFVMTQISGQETEESLLISPKSLRLQITSASKLISVLFFSDSPSSLKLIAFFESLFWCTGKYLFQATDIMGSLIVDFNHMLTGQDDMTFLYKLA